MKKNFCKIIFCVDRSGSMKTVQSDMIGGFNTFIEKQKSLNVGECTVSFNQFNVTLEEVYKNIDIQLVPELTNKTFVPSGYTALYDAVGNTVKNIGQELEILSEENRPEKVLVVILTDGEDNYSSEFSSMQVSEMVKHQTEKYNWEFVYLGANQDVWSVARILGIDVHNTSGYVSRGINTKVSSDSLWNTLSNKTMNYRSVVGSKMNFTAEEQKEQNDLISGNFP